MSSSTPKSSNTIMEEKIEEMVTECLAFRKRKLNDLYEQKTAHCSLSYLIRHLLRIGKYDVLLDALTSERPDSECITLPRTVDGRIFINGKKYDAQTYFCRLWRFPNVKARNHIEPIENCINADYDNYSYENMCVNPYHFTKHSELLGKKAVPKKGTQAIPKQASPIKTIIVKNQDTVHTVKAERSAKRKLSEIEMNTKTMLLSENEEDPPNSFTIEAKDHPNSLGNSLLGPGLNPNHCDTEIFCSDGVVKQHR